MPTLRVRNVTRGAGSQNVSTNNTSTSNSNSTRPRKHTQNENKAQDNDKENAGRQELRTTRLHTRTGVRTGSLTSNAALGSVTATARKGGSKGENTTSSKLKTASKGKGVPPSAPVQRNKMPLQDITAQFLPAPEAANRGEGAQTPSEDVIEHENTAPRSEGTANTVVAKMLPPEPASVPLPASPKFAVASPLPPSSPPSDHEVTISRVFNRSMTSASNIFDVNFHSPSSLADTIPQELDDPWQEYDGNAPQSEVINDANALKSEPESDPFGFKSLQMKLNAQLKEAAALTSDQDHDDEYDILLPVADTSSPRPVRRLKRSLQYEEDDVPAEYFSDSEERHDNRPHLQPHYTTPCTPNKASQKRRRMSPQKDQDAQDPFGPYSSSVATSPSPSKPSNNAQK